MSERSNEVRNELETYVSEREAWIADAVELITGDRTIDPAIALTERTMNVEDAARDDVVGLQLDETQEQELRKIAGRFGIGGEADVRSLADHQMLEGGKPWKIESQLAIAIDEDTQSIIMLGWPGRKLGVDETTYLHEKFGRAAENEYEMVRQLVEVQPGFEPLEADEVLPFGYDINDSNRLVESETGQLTKIGLLDGVPVLMARIDNNWETVVNEETGETRREPRNRPDSAAMMLFVSAVLDACGDDASSVGFNTSNTYASRTIDTVRAGLKAGRSFSVGMYGRNTIGHTIRDTVAALKDKGVEEKDIPKVPAQTPINQIPSELRIINFDKLQPLKAELTELGLSQ